MLQVVLQLPYSTV